MHNRKTGFGQPKSRVSTTKKWGCTTENWGLGNQKVGLHNRKVGLAQPFYKMVGHLIDKS